MGQREINAVAEEKRRAVLELLRRKPGLMTREIAQELDWPFRRVAYVLRSLCVKGAVKNAAELGGDARWVAALVPLRGRSVFELRGVA